MLLIFSNLNKFLKIAIYIILPMQNYIFVATSLILVYVIYLIRHIVSNFSFFMFQMWFVRKLLYKCIEMHLFIIFTIKSIGWWLCPVLNSLNWREIFVEAV